MEGRKYPHRVAAPPPVAVAIPTPGAPGKIAPPPPNLLIQAAAPSMMAEGEGTRQEKRKKRKQKEQVEVPVALSPSPCPPVTPEPKLESRRPFPPESLASVVDAAVRGKKQEEYQAAPSIMAEEDATRLKTRKKRKQKEQVEVPVAPSPSPCPPLTPDLELEYPRPISSEMDVAVTGMKQEEYQAAPSMMAEEEATRLKMRKRKKQNEQVGVPVALSSSSCHSVTLEHNPRPLAPETLCSEVDAAVRGKKQEQEEVQAVAASLLLEPVVETGGKEEMKKRKRKKHEEGSVFQSQSAIAGAPILEGEHKMADAVVPAPEQGKRKSRRMKEQEQSSQSPLPFDVHSQGGEAALDGPQSKSVTVRRSSSRKKAHSPSNSEILRMRIEARKHQPLPEGFLDFKTIAANPDHSCPLDVFFSQFIYRPERRQEHNSPSFPKTPDRRARLVPRGHSSSGPSQLSANGTSKAPKKTALNAKVKEKPGKRMVAKERKPKPLFTAAEKRSEKYRRVPLDQLVPPPRSPHNLLQEKYASDPWKVIVICMLLNVTQGTQVKKLLPGFFEQYPDPQTAIHADPLKMKEYLSSLGLKNVRVRRIKEFSKQYVENEWTHITQLDGVGKYAADAYAIFCAGRAAEVVPEDHKLVDYWNYVCNELPLVQRSENAL